MLFLDETFVRAHLHMEALIPAMERALAALSSGQVVQPTRVMVPVAAAGGFLGSMPAYAGGQLGAKLVTFFPNNQGVPTHHALIVLFRPETGEPLVVMDGRLITEMRTAAVSAVATKILSREDAGVLAILGAGAQARSHLEALRLVRAVREVRVWSPRSAARFAREFGVEEAQTAEHAVRGADLVVVATTSKTPVVRGDWLSPGVHINAVGAVRPDWRELDDDVLHRARVYVDSRDAAVLESGDVRAAGGRITEIGEVVAGMESGRESAGQVTVFKSVGVAAEDLASAELVYRQV